MVKPQPPPGPYNTMHDANMRRLNSPRQHTTSVIANPTTRETRRRIRRIGVRFQNTLASTFGEISRGIKRMRVTKKRKHHKKRKSRKHRK
jgi:hypothetical protein